MREEILKKMKEQELKEVSDFIMFLNWKMNKIRLLEAQIALIERPPFYKIGDKRAALIEERNIIYNEILHELVFYTNSKIPQLRYHQEDCSKHLSQIEQFIAIWNSEEFQLLRKQM